jgi:hypothetical protein
LNNLCVNFKSHTLWNFRDLPKVINSKLIESRGSPSKLTKSRLSWTMSRRKMNPQSSNSGVIIKSSLRR